MGALKRLFYSGLVSLGLIGSASAQDGAIVKSNLDTTADVHRMSKSEVLQYGKRGIEGYFQGVFGDEITKRSDFWGEDGIAANMLNRIGIDLHEENSDLESILGERYEGDGRRDYYTEEDILKLHSEVVDFLENKEKTLEDMTMSRPEENIARMEFDGGNFQLENDSSDVVLNDDSEKKSLHDMSSVSDIIDNFYAVPMELSPLDTSTIASRMYNNVVKKMYINEHGKSPTFHEAGKIMGKLRSRISEKRDSLLFDEYIARKNNGEISSVAELAREKDMNESTAQGMMRRERERRKETDIPTYMMDSITVTPEQEDEVEEWNGSEMSGLIRKTSLTTQVPGITTSFSKDMGPDQARYSINEMYFALPLFANQDTEDIKYEQLKPAVENPSVKHSSADAVLKLETNIDTNETIYVNPLKQKITAGFGEQSESVEFKASASAEHRNAEHLKGIENTFDAYPRIVQASGGFEVEGEEFNVGGVAGKTSLWNSFENIMGFDHLEEELSQNFIFVEGGKDLGLSSVEASYSYQQGDWTTNNGYQGTTNDRAEDLTLETFSASFEHKDIEVMLSRNHLKKNLLYEKIKETGHDSTMFSKDFVDTRVVASRKINEPGLRAEFQGGIDFMEGPHFSGSVHLYSYGKDHGVELNAGHLYNSLERLEGVVGDIYPTQGPSPQITNHLELSLHKEGRVDASVSGSLKNVELDFMGRPARISGGVLRGEVGGPDWKLGGTYRNISLHTHGKDQQFPGAAPIEMWGYVNGVIDVDAVFRQGMRFPLRPGESADLGTQLFVSAGKSFDIGPFELDVSLTNILGGIFDNNIAAYHLETKDNVMINYVKLPAMLPMVGLRYSQR